VRAYALAHPSLPCTVAEGHMETSMYLSSPEWPTNFSKSQPLEDVLVFIIGLAVDFNSMSGTVTTGVYMNGASAQDGSNPVDTWVVSCGQMFQFKDENNEDVVVTFPTLQKIIEDNAEHFNAIKTYLYDKLKWMPAFKNSTVVAP
jgi:hypothetical protein